MALVNETPPPDAPGRHLYQNFAFFIGNLTPPWGASAGEKSLYIKLVERLDANGDLADGAATRIFAELRKAISERPYYFRLLNFSLWPTKTISRPSLDGVFVSVDGAHTRRVLFFACDGNPNSYPSA